MTWQLSTYEWEGSTGLAVLRELWHWRESEALSANRPPFFILHHDTLVDLADAASSQGRFDHLLPRHLSPRRGDGIKQAIGKALALPPDQHPQLPKRDRHRPSEAETRRFRELEKRRDKHAHELAIDPTLIAPRATLGELAKNWDASAPELMNWQRELLK